MKTRLLLLIIALTSTITICAQSVPTSGECKTVYHNYLKQINRYSEDVVGQSSYEYQRNIVVKLFYGDNRGHSLRKNDLEFLLRHIKGSNQESADVVGIQVYLDRLARIIRDDLQDVKFESIVFGYNPNNAKVYSSAEGTKYSVEEYLAVSWKKIGETTPHNDTIQTSKVYTFVNQDGAVKIKKVEETIAPRIREKPTKGIRTKPRTKWGRYNDDINIGLNFSISLGKENGYGLGAFIEGEMFRGGLELVKPFHEGYYEYYPDPIEGHFSELSYTPQRKDIGYMADIGFILPTWEDGAPRFIPNAGIGIGLYDYKGIGNGHDKKAVILKFGVIGNFEIDAGVVELEVSYQYSPCDKFKGVRFGLGMGLAVE